MGIMLNIYFLAAILLYLRAYYLPCGNKYFIHKTRKAPISELVKNIKHSVAYFLNHSIRSSSNSLTIGIQRSKRFSPFVCFIRQFTAAQAAVLLTVYILHMNSW
jgi:hypothetical protein